MLEALIAETRNERHVRLLKALQQASDFLERSEPPVLVVSHYDADGLSAAAAITLTLERLGLPYQLKIEEQLTPELVEEALKGPYETLIFLDMGSGVLSAIRGEKRVLVVDHHIPQGDPAPNVLEVNPHRYGVNGSVEVSSSSLALLVMDGAIGQGEDYAHLAIVGALGDRQDQGPRFALTGINGLIVALAREAGVIEETIGLRLYGVHSRPLVRALALTMDPLLPGLTGNEEACIKFLKSIGVNPVNGDRLRKYSELSIEEKRTLATELVKLLINSGYPVNEAERIFGTMYYIRREDAQSPLRDAREFSYIVNACGRLDRHSIALLLLRGVKGEIIARALDQVRLYRKLLFRAIRAARDGACNRIRLGKILALDYGETVPPKVAGALASILASSLKTDATVLLVMVKHGDRHVKVSARKTAGRGRVNIGEALSIAARASGGVGGGHAEAGGALLPAENTEIFLNELNRALEGVSSEVNM